MRSIAALLIALAVVLSGCGDNGRATEALTPALDSGRVTFARSCAMCHGGNGQGGSGPALDHVVETFQGCDGQIAWVALGSVAYAQTVDSTFPDGREIRGSMPGFDRVLSAEEIARVVAFTRHRFAGIDQSEVVEDCGVS